MIATSVERTAPGDWGVQADRVGEDRLIEVAARSPMISSPATSRRRLREANPNRPPGARGSGPSRKPASGEKARRGVSFLEIVSLVQNSAPEDRIVSALRKHGMKFKPRDAALNQLRSLGASESLISAVKNSNVVS